MPECWGSLVSPQPMRAGDVAEEESKSMQKTKPIENLKHSDNSKDSIPKSEMGVRKYYLLLFLAFLFVDFPVFCYFLFEIGNDLTIEFLYTLFFGGISDLLSLHQGFTLIIPLFMMYYGVAIRRIHAIVIFLIGFILFSFVCLLGISAGV
jgi:hypothetical protein